MALWYWMSARCPIFSSWPRNIHDGGNHADIDHDPAKGYADPMLAEVHRESICDQTGRHTTDGKPDAMEPIFWNPVGLMAVEYPVIEYIADSPTCHENPC